MLTASTVQKIHIENFILYAYASKEAYKPKDNFFHHILSMSGFLLLKLISLLQCGKHKQ